jgi:hypothetical protein
MDYTFYFEEIIANQNQFYNLLSNFDFNFLSGLIIGALIGLAFWIVAKGAA